MWIADLITDDNERIFVPFLRKVQNVFQRTVAFHRTHGDHALMRFCHAHEIQFPFITVYNDDTGFSGGGGYEPQRVVRVALGTIDLIYGTSGTDRFDDRIAPFNQFVSVFILLIHYVGPSVLLRFLFTI